ncbi:MAG: hypothetical protein IVW52_13390 [Acidimicrobiales bacterium]|nr:hypothetical protein [Acidimicrobiales bacterium]
MRRVVSITTNSSVSEKISQTEDEGLELSRVANVGTQDLVRRIVAEFRQPTATVEYFDGVLFASGDNGVSHEAAIAHFDPATIGTEDGALVAFLDGQRTSRGVFADLDFLLEARPDVLVVLNNCRGRWGPFVQGGVARLLETHPERYAFQLLADLAPGLGGSNLGVVYATDGRHGFPELVSQLVGSLGMQLDPLTLLVRQQTQLEFNQEMAVRATESEAEARWLKSQLEAVRHTTSWRVTAPIRAASRLLSGRR